MVVDQVFGVLTSDLISETLGVTAPWNAAKSMSQTNEQSLPPGVREALQRRPRNRNTTRSYASFGGISDVCAPNPNNTDNVLNKFDLLCPREGCSSVILKASVANLVERASVEVSYFSAVRRLFILSVTE